VPQTLQCADCRRAAKFVGFVKPDRYEYRCTSCQSTTLLTLNEINELESSRFHKLPVNIPAIITAKATHH
jgi:hypothetical protein